MSLFVDIRKDFGNFKLDVTFTAENGITSLLGASGCGKSMTLKCIAGIEKPDEGRIELDGDVLFDSERGVNLPPQERKVGYLFQNYALFPNMTVRQNILCGLCREHDRQTKEKRLQEMLRLLQLEGLEKRRPSQLSGGQQQRVALARILVNDPHMLLLDEPFSALDYHLRDSLKIELRDLLMSYGKEVLMVTHDRNEAYNMSSMIAVMDRGKLLTLKSAKDLFADPGSVPAAMITGCKNIAVAVKVGEFEADVPAWGIRLKTSVPLRDDLKAIGIRAHYFNPNCPQNRFRVVFTEEMEEPFETILQFRYAGQREDCPPVWWRLTKDRKPSVFPEEIGIAPANILPLYE